VHSDNAKRLEEFRHKAQEHLALDNAGELTYIAPTRINLDLTMERWPEIEFRTRASIKDDCCVAGRAQCQSLSQSRSQQST
jgi:peptide subunit release factor RF-3